MATTPCTACGKNVSNQALSCPECGQPNPAVKPAVQAVLSVLILGLFAWWFFGNGLTSHVEDQMVQQALAEYQIAWRSNDRVQTCVHAGIVAAAYLHAKDEANYNQWLSTEKKECKVAGVPR